MLPADMHECNLGLLHLQALNFNGRLKYLHLQGSSSPPQLALFAIATPLQPPSVMAIRTKTLIFQTKHSMDFAPMGIDTRWAPVVNLLK